MELVMLTGLNTHSRSPLQLLRGCDRSPVGSNDSRRIAQRAPAASQTRSSTRHRVLTLMTLSRCGPPPEALRQPDLTPRSLKFSSPLLLPRALRPWPCAGLGSAWPCRLPADAPLILDWQFFIPFKQALVIFQRLFNFLAFSTMTATPLQKPSTSGICILLAVVVSARFLPDTPARVC